MVNTMQDNLRTPLNTGINLTIRDRLMTANKQRRKAADRIDELESWIRQEGDQTDTCVEPILGEICVGCRCGKQKLKKAQ